MERSASRQDASHRDAATTILFLALALGALWFVCCRHLSNEWSINEQYNYGWFVPFFAAYLFWLRWEDRPQIRGRRPDKGGGRVIAISIAVAALFALLPLRIFEIGNPDWRPLGWAHAAIVVSLTLLVIWFAGGGRWLRHFAFPIAFIFVAVPWVSPIEEPILQGLMRGVAAIAAETMTLFGVPAQLEGNLIRVSSGLVGVNEACSGVRSLQTSLMIGLLFGELKRLTIPRRLALLGAAVTIALVANCWRALLLVWIAATKGLPAIDRWHDIAGYGIVALVFAGTMWMASKLGSRKAKVENDVAIPRSLRAGGSPGPEAAIHNPSFRLSLSPFYFLLLFLWLLLVEAGGEFWYRAHERNSAAGERWDVRWPESAPGFHEIRIDDGVRSALRFDKGREVWWRLPAAFPADPAGACFLFLFRWEPGTSTILRARAHRPDICLPTAGWRQIADGGVRPYPVTPELSLRFHHFTFVREAALNRHRAFAHAFFCLREDTMRAADQRINQANLDSETPGNWSPMDRLRVVREGLRNPGQQVMEVIMLTAHEVRDAEAETSFADLVRELVIVKADNSK
jgi:exosortase